MERAGRVRLQPQEWKDIASFWNDDFLPRWTSQVGGEEATRGGGGEGEAARGVDGGLAAAQSRFETAYHEY